MPLLITILATTIIVLTVIYHFAPSARKTVIFFGSSVGVPAAVFGVALAHLQLKEVAKQYTLSAEQHSQAVRHFRQQVAFSFMEKWRILPLATTALVLQETGEMDGDAINTYLRSDPTKGKVITDLLNFFEEMALAAQLDYGEEAALCALFEEPAVRYYDHFEDAIEVYRKETKRYGIYEHYQEMYKRWRRGCP